MNWIDNSIGTHARALVLWTERAEVLAGNIANADTPRFKAQDIDFKQVMAREPGATTSAGLRTTHSRHIGNNAAAVSVDHYFRESPRSTPDGNTVQTEVEQAAYTENAVKFQASAQFFDGSLRTLRKALRGD